ncbi:hypothetical protein R83H12_01304 [Fibrobacteria bacterium R8-3-H12]
MIFTEWNWDDAKQVWQEEAREKEREKALKETFSLLRQGYSLDEAEKLLTKQKTAHFGYAQ